MKYLSLLAVLILAGCSSSPTSPTPPPIVVNQPPVAVTPPILVPPPAPAFPPHDPRFDLTFYREFVHNAYDSPGFLSPLQRQRQAPRIYLRTIDDAGAPMDALTLTQTAAALESTAGSLTGVFGVAGIERGTDTRIGQPGWITVRWSSVAFRDGTFNVCGEAPVGGDLMTLYPKSLGCRCGGGPAVSLATIKHELGHALGFWHTDSRDDLMYPQLRSCDMNPSAREQYHAAIAYTRAIGSLAP